MKETGTDEVIDYHFSADGRTYSRAACGQKLGSEHWVLVLNVEGITCPECRSKPEFHMALLKAYVK